MAKKRGGRVVKAGGAVAIIALLIGMYTGFGLGLGGGGGAGTTSGTVSLGQADTTEKTPSESDEDDASEETAEGLQDDGLLVVLIDGYDFSIGTTVGDQKVYRAADDSRVVALARQSRKNDSGIRVQVERRASARGSAEERLKGLLQTAGVADLDILWVEETIP